MARKALATRIPVYRFYNSSTGAHFFTTSTTERDSIVATLSPPFSLEGAAFSVASAFSPGLSPVHRFFNTQTGVHFYTISESERASVAATLPQFIYEGIAYHASQVNGQGLTPIYRFYVPSKGFHFYTASSTERDNIIATLSSVYSYEGPAYYVPSSSWNADTMACGRPSRVGGRLWTPADRALGMLWRAPRLSGMPTARHPTPLAHPRHHHDSAACPPRDMTRPWHATAHAATHRHAHRAT